MTESPKTLQPGVVDAMMLNACFEAVFVQASENSSSDLTLATQHIADSGGSHILHDKKPFW